MSTTVIKSTAVISGSTFSRTGLSAFERYVVRRAHPSGIFIETAGLMWAVYFLFSHLWVEALMTAILTRLIATAATYRANPDALAETALGKIALLHLHPVNAVVQLAGIAGLAYGVWAHETRVVLAGVTVLLLGHLAGWGQVDKRFESH